MKYLPLILCVLSLVPLNPAQAAAKKPAAKRPAIKIVSSGPTISAVSANSITVGKQTFAITPNTHILLDGRKADAGALKVGMRVAVTPSALELGSAKSITADSPQ